MLPAFVELYIRNHLRSDLTYVRFDLLVHFRVVYQYPVVVFGKKVTNQAFGHVQITIEQSRRFGIG